MGHLLDSGHWADLVCGFHRWTSAYTVDPFVSNNHIQHRHLISDIWYHWHSDIRRVHRHQSPFRYPTNLNIYIYFFHISWNGTHARWVLRWVHYHAATKIIYATCDVRYHKIDKVYFNIWYSGGLRPPLSSVRYQMFRYLSHFVNAEQEYGTKCPPTVVLNPWGSRFWTTTLVTA